MQGRLHVDSLKSAGNGPIHSPVSGPIKIKTQTDKKQTNKAHKTTTKPKPNKTKEKWDFTCLIQRSPLRTLAWSQRSRPLICRSLPAPSLLDNIFTAELSVCKITGVFACFVWFCFLLFAFLVCTVTAQWIMYWSNSVLFCMHIVVMTDVAAALIRWICKMQLSFRLDKRPGESHLALDGKIKVSV